MPHPSPTLAPIVDEILNRIALRPPAEEATPLLHLLRDLGAL